MELTQTDALRAYAKMMNTLRTEPLESLLAEDFTYESQTVFQVAPCMSFRHAAFHGNVEWTGIAPYDEAAVGERLLAHRTSPD